MAGRAPFEIGDHKIAPGARQTVNLPVSVLSDHTPVTLSVHVIHGRRAGPVLFVSAAIHGDEIIGVEIARRLLRSATIEGLRGTLLVVPIVNTFGFLNHSRYLPDRRDLNRCFPGGPSGSLAARLADIFMREIVDRADFGIDLHSAAVHRINMPQIRVSTSKAETLKLAEAFGAPVIVLSKLREGSLRHAAQERGVDILLFEAGEGLRFDEWSARAGVAGILRVMHEMGMISRRVASRAKTKSLRATSSSWQRAPVGGLIRVFKAAGESVSEGDILGVIADPFGEVETELESAYAGVIIGRTNLPVVNEGDALFHIASTTSLDPDETIEALVSQLTADPLFDEDEII
jgi:predicted deacylase